MYDNKHFHVVLTCPRHWSFAAVRELARRLADDNIPTAVGVEIHESPSPTVVREVSDND